MEIPTVLRNLVDWDTATSAERHSAAATIATQLPDTWKFTGLQTFTLGDQTHEIASFVLYGAIFRLIPGSSRAVLGYDRETPWIPPAELADDLEELRRDWFDWTLYENDFAPLRTVSLAPCLVEAVSTGSNWQEERDEEDEEVAITPHHVAESYRKNGFRLPTSDEWEYLCRAGTRALWRWGNTIPLEEAHIASSDIHKRLNAFGMIFCTSTTDLELCDDGELPATDGGSSICGCLGLTASWIPLSCAFRYNREEARDLLIESSHSMHVRRLLPLTK